MTSIITAEHAREIIASHRVGDGVGATTCARIARSGTAVGHGGLNAVVGRVADGVVAAVVDRVAAGKIAHAERGESRGVAVAELAHAVLVHVSVAALVWVLHAVRSAHHTGSAVDRLIGASKSFGPCAISAGAAQAGLRRLGKRGAVGRRDGYRKEDNVGDDGRDDEHHHGGAGEVGSSHDCVLVGKKTPPLQCENERVARCLLYTCACVRRT